MPSAERRYGSAGPRAAFRMPKPPRTANAIHVNESRWYPLRALIDGWYPPARRRNRGRLTRAAIAPYGGLVRKGTFVGIAVPMLLLAVGLGGGRIAAARADATVTPDADARVQQATPAQNSGRGVYLRTDGG